MRLLDAEALIYDNVAELVDFPDESSAPPYAILSHTWAQEEVLFHDIPLGPQYEIQGSVASVRAMHRQQAMHRRNSDILSSEEEEVEGWDEDSIPTIMLHPPAESTELNVSDEDSIHAILLHSPASSAELDGLDPDRTDRTTSKSLPDYVANLNAAPLNSRTFGSTIHKSSSFEATGTSGIGSFVPHVKAGWIKVLNACLQTLRDGLAYIWIDTCCIDKSSSAELSEAINSMFRWYQSSTTCYAYLYDCHWKPESNGAPTNTDIYKASLLCSKYNLFLDVLRDPYQVAAIRECVNSCRWFSRGWTLQELIAPKRLYFFDREWRWIEERDRIRHILEEITGIHGPVLCFQRWENFKVSRLSSYSVAQRMFWASKRETTRTEDKAYCLLGIFGLNMPLLYGEGAQAFQRLQQEIIRTSTDQSVLAWEMLPRDCGEGESKLPGLLAPSPANFWGKAQHIIAQSHPGQSTYGGFRFTNEGIEIELGLDAYRIKNGFHTIVAVLDCIMEGSQTRVGVWLQIQAAELPRRLSSRHRLEATFASGWTSAGSGRLVEIPYFEPLDVDYHRHPLVISDATWQSFSPTNVNPPTIEILIGPAYTSKGQISRETMLKSVEVHPSFQWQKKRGKIILPLGKKSFVAIAVQHRNRNRRFIIVIGTKSTVTQTAFGPRYENVLHRHWILPALESDDASHGRLSVERRQKYLHTLCDRAASFALKDYYENTTKREDSSKVLRLPSGELVSVRFVESQFGSSSNYRSLEFKLERRDKFVLLATEEHYFHRNYFHIDQLQHSLRDPVPQILVNGEDLLETQ